MTEYPMGSVNQTLSPYRTHGTVPQPTIGTLYHRSYHSVMSAVTVVGHRLLITLAPPEAYAFADGKPRGEHAFTVLEDRVTKAAIRLSVFNITPRDILDLAFPENLPGEEIKVENRPLKQTNLAYQVLVPVVYTTWLRILLGNKQFRDDCISVFTKGIDTLELPFLESYPDVRRFGMDKPIKDLADLPPTGVRDVGYSENIMGNQCLLAITDIIKDIVPTTIMVVDFSHDMFVDNLFYDGEWIMIVALRSPRTEFLLALTEALLIPGALKLVFMNTTGEYIPSLPNDKYNTHFVETLKQVENWLLQHDVRDIYISGHVYVSTHYYFSCFSKK